MRKKSAGRMALCGVLGALSLVVLLTGSLIPVATFCAPAFSGVLIMIAAAECGLKMGWVLYLTVALLAVVLVPDKETAFVFVFLLGHYPLLKARLERLKSKLLRFVVKTAVFNGCIGLAYTLLLTIFSLPSLRQEMAETTRGFLAVLLVLGNVTFWVYDRALERVLAFYVVKWQPRLRFSR